MLLNGNIGVTSVTKEISGKYVAEIHTVKVVGLRESQTTPKTITHSASFEFTHAALQIGKPQTS